MKIGEGRITIESYATPEDVIRKILSFTNTSQWMIENKVMEIFATQGKSRVQTANQIGEDIENPGSTWHNRLISNINSEHLMERIMEFGSNLGTMNAKKALMIYLINNGFHINFPDKMYYNEHMVSTEIDNDALQKLNTMNSIVNAMTRAFIKFNKVAVGDIAFQEFLKKIERFDKSYKVIIDSDGNETSIRDIAEEYSRNFYEYSSSVIHRRFRSYFVDENGNVAEEDYKEFMTAIEEYWEVIKHYFKPTEKVLYKYYQMAETTFRTNRNEVLALLQNTLGIDLSREVL